MFIKQFIFFQIHKAQINPSTTEINRAIDPQHDCTNATLTQAKRQTIRAKQKINIKAAQRKTMQQFRRISGSQQKRRNWSCRSLTVLI